MKKPSQPDARLWARRLATRRDDGLDQAPLRELLQRLMATEEALAALGSEARDPRDHRSSTAPEHTAPDDTALDDTRELILRHQGALVRELRRRRVAASGRWDAEPRRTPSAAWPPPPW
jgi:hypothetical protein